MTLTTWRRAIVRPSLVAGGEIAVYYALPLGDEVDAGTIVWLVVGLGSLVGIVLFEIVRIENSAYPRLRALLAVATILPLFLILFASAYFVASRADSSAFSENLSRTDSLYFTVTTFSTVGYGDITPRTGGTRVLVMIQMVGDLMLIGVIGRVILNAAARGLEHNTRPPLPDPMGEPDRPVIPRG